MLKILNLKSGYGKLIVLKGISIHVSPGELVTIIGANGAGKSTLLNTISGIVPSVSGEMHFCDERIESVKAEKILGLGCALVPEGRQVFNTLTVKENLVLGGYIKLKKREGKIVEEILEEIYTMFPILKERGSQLAGTLSGGEQQMLAIGRALMSKPRFLMMDEPFMGIAPIIVNEIIETIKKLKARGITMLLVEQNAKAALNIADRGYVIETGQIVIEGSSEELLNNQDVQRAYLGKDYKTIDE
jgi:branched-chain amino acid transport system ATP-binding protein